MCNVKCEKFHILLGSSSPHVEDVGNPVTNHSTDPQHTHGEDECHPDIEDTEVLNISTDTNISSSLYQSSSPFTTAVQNPFYESPNDSISSVSSLPSDWVSQKDRHNKDHKEDIHTRNVPLSSIEEAFGRRIRKFESDMDEENSMHLPDMSPCSPPGYLQQNLDTSQHSIIDLTGSPSALSSLTSIGGCTSKSNHSQSVTSTGDTSKTPSPIFKPIEM